MDFYKTLKHIDEFYATADEETRKKVDDAFSIDMDGDVTIGDYIDDFNECYSFD